MSWRDDTGLEKALADVETICKNDRILSPTENTDTSIADNDFCDYNDIIPTGDIEMDFVLGVGGMPKGIVAELSGDESSGKTTLCLQFVANAQKMGKTVVFVDAEYSLNMFYARNLGVDTENLLISHPQNGEDTFIIIETLIKRRLVDIVVVDSVSALVPHKEVGRGIDIQDTISQSLLIKYALRRLIGIANKYNVLIIFINQMRDRVKEIYGKPYRTTGGKALKASAPLRIEMTSLGEIKRNNMYIGKYTKIGIIKNRIGYPMRRFVSEIYYGSGILREVSLLNMCVNLGILDRSRGYVLKLTGEYLGKNREDTIEYIRERYNDYFYPLMRNLLFGTEIPLICR